MKPIRVLLLSLAVWLMSSPLSAEIPTLINYQGRLRGTNGIPIEGQLPVQVEIYDAETGGQRHYQENIGPVAFVNGVYSFHFGSPILASALVGGSSWLSVIVDGNVLTPRQRLVAVPYALVAASIQTANLSAQNGRLGIGTNAPARPLHVTVAAESGPDRTLALFENTAAGPLAAAGIALRSGTNSMYFSVAHPDYLGTPLYRNRSIIWTLDNEGLVLSSLGPSSKIIFATGNDEQRMVIGNNGNVGIGTTSPSEALQVQGKVLADAHPTTSDARLKRDIREVENPLAIIRQLRGVAFSWDSTNNPGRGLDERRHLGLIAQEVEAVLPQAVSTAKDDIKSIEYDALIPVLIEAIKAQQAQINELKRRIQAME